MRRCNGVCNRYKAFKKSGKDWFKPGVKRCNMCEIFIEFEGNVCPCCNSRLSTRPKIGRKNVKAIDDE